MVYDYNERQLWTRSLLLSNKLGRCPSSQCRLLILLPNRQGDLENDRDKTNGVITQREVRGEVHITYHTWCLTCFSKELRFQRRCKDVLRCPYQGIPGEASILGPQNWSSRPWRIVVLVPGATPRPYR
eukprot:scaffold1690_cov182-Amphora_coffeaeformis.AAC.66